MVEEYEESIEEWYMKHKEKVSLTTFLCEKQILISNENCINYPLDIFLKFSIFI